MFSSKGEDLKPRVSFISEGRPMLVFSLPEN